MSVRLVCPNCGQENFLKLPICKNCQAQLDHALIKFHPLQLQAEALYSAETKEIVLIRKACPFCATEDAVGASICRQCGRSLAKTRESEPVASARQLPGRWMVIIGAALLMIGAALPWLTVSTPVIGTLPSAWLWGDGAYSWGIGFPMLMAAALSRDKPGKTYPILGIVLGVIALLIIVSKLTVIESALIHFEGIESIGLGLYLSAVGALLVLLGSIRWSSLQVASPAVAGSMA